MLIYHAPRLLLPETLSLDKPDNQNSELSYLACTRRPINQTYFFMQFQTLRGHLCNCIILKDGSTVSKLSYVVCSFVLNSLLQRRTIEKRLKLRNSSTGCVQLPRPIGMKFKHISPVVPCVSNRWNHCSRHPRLISKLCAFCRVIADK